MYIYAKVSVNNDSSSIVSGENATTLADQMSAAVMQRSEPVFTRELQIIVMNDDGSICYTAGGRPVEVSFTL